MTIILTDQMLEEATKVAGGLHTSFSGVLKLPNVAGRRASTLSNELGVGRMTCQRITKLGKLTGDDSAPGPRLLAELPGVSGLRQFLDALLKQGTPRSVLLGAQEAVDAFDLYLRDLGVSQTAFASALLLHDAASDPERRCQQRRKLFDAASAVTGQSADATISMMALQARERQDFNFEQIAVRGYSGMRASESAMPIRLPINMAYSDYRNITGDEAAREPQALVEPFCTSPLPSIDSRVIKQQHLAHLVDPAHIPTGEPFDCFATQHNRWNVPGAGPHKAIWLYVDYPTRHCTFDLYVPHGMEQMNLISGDCHLWGTSLLAPPEDLWMTRFADQIEFTRLGTGTENAASSAYTRHRELTEHMFEHHGWDPAKFVGFRCEMSFPVWRSGLCIVLEEK